MKHFQKAAYEALSNKPKNELVGLIRRFSSRIDLLEKFISDETQFEGTKVGFVLEHGPEKTNWLKDELTELSLLITKESP